MTDQPLTIDIHPSAFPDWARAAAVAGLREGRIPARFLYQSDAQAERWLTYHRAYSPSRTDELLRGQYRDAFRAAVNLLGAEPLAAISLGCGGGHKDGDLFDAVPAAARPRCLYTPLDASPALVLEAAQHVASRHPLLPTLPLVADIDADPEVSVWLDRRADAALPRLVCALGLLPNLEPVKLLEYLRSQVRAGDALLISANQSPRGLSADGARILGQYDNPPARAWYEGAAEGLGIPTAEMDLHVEAVPVEPGGHWWRIAVTLHPRHDLSVRLYGESVPWRKGQSIALFHSHRFTRAALCTRLNAARLEIVADWQSANGEEGIYLLRRAGAPG